MAKENKEVVEETTNPVEEITEENTEQSIEEVVEEPKVDESKFDSAGDDGVVKIDLSKPPVEPKKEEEITKVNIDEKTTEKVEEQSVIEEVTEEEINNILSHIVDFKLEFSVDGKNILTDIKYGDNKWSLDMTSGMEKFISSLAIRVALINISSLPRPTFLAIDEGFGNLDSNNINSIALLFDYLKTEFDFMLVISHIDVMRDMVDDLIEISRNGQLSKVIY